MPKVGRPAKYTSPKKLQKKIDDYFSFGHNKRKVVVGKGENQQVIEIPILTISGLVRYCGFSNRASFYDLESREKFTNTIKSARNRIEEEYEELLQRGLGVGAIFALKNFGWIDTPLIDQSSHTHFTKIDIKDLEGKSREELVDIVFRRNNGAVVRKS